VLARAKPTHSTANDLTKCMTAALEALYGAWRFGRLTMWPLIDAVAMKLPYVKPSSLRPSSVVPSRFCLLQCRPATRAQLKTPSTFVVMILEKFAGLPSRLGPSVHGMPELATKMSSRPLNSVTI